MVETSVGTHWWVIGILLGVVGTLSAGFGSWVISKIKGHTEQLGAIGKSVTALEVSVGYIKEGVDEIKDDLHEHLRNGK